MFSWQLFINDAWRFAALSGIALIVVYAFSVVTRQSTLNWLSVALCVMIPILIGFTIAGLFSYYRWVERGRSKPLLRLLIAILLVLIAALIAWMFKW
jgi:hypothetical protein